MELKQRHTVNEALMKKQENHFRLTLPEEVRTTTRLLFVNVLGCQVQYPDDNIEIYVFNDQTFIGVYYSNASKPASASENPLNAWTEVHITENRELLSMLKPLGVKEINYGGPVGPCFQAADGAVFRFVA